MEEGEKGGEVSHSGRSPIKAILRRDEGFQDLAISYQIEQGLSDGAEGFHPQGGGFLDDDELFQGETVFAEVDGDPRMSLYGMDPPISRLDPLEKVSRREDFPWNPSRPQRCAS